MTSQVFPLFNFLDVSSLGQSNFPSCLQFKKNPNLLHPNECFPTRAGAVTGSEGRRGKADLGALPVSWSVRGQWGRTRLLTQISHHSHRREGVIRQPDPVSAFVCFAFCLFFYSTSYSAESTELFFFQCEVEAQGFSCPHGWSAGSSVLISWVNKCHMAEEILASRSGLVGVCVAVCVHVCRHISQQIQVIYLSAPRYCFLWG